MLPPAAHSAYGLFYDAVRSQEYLDERTIAVAGLAAAIARECKP